MCVQITRLDHIAAFPVCIRRSGQHEYIFLKNHALIKPIFLLV